MEGLEVLQGMTLAEMLAAVQEPSLADQREVLLALAANAVAERVEDLSEAEVVSATEAALTHVAEYPHLCLAVICNMSVVEKHAEVFLAQTATGPLARYLSNALEQFLDYNPQAEAGGPLAAAGEGAGEGESDEDSFWSEADPYGHMASVLCNLAVLPEGRAVLLRQSSNYMPRLALQFRSRNVARRRGAVGAVRTCLFDTETHWWMVFEVKVLTALLTPLVAPTPFTEDEKKGMDPRLWMQAEDPDKRPDADKAVLKMLLESLLLLCQRRGMREELRKRKVYPVIRNLDLFLEDEEVNAVVVDLVDFLIRDEEPGAAPPGEAVPAQYLLEAGAGAGAGGQ